MGAPAGADEQAIEEGTDARDGRDRVISSSSPNAARTSATEVRAGLTTFMVMAYIIFLNPNIIAKPLGLGPAPSRRRPGRRWWPAS